MGAIKLLATLPLAALLAAAGTPSPEHGGSSEAAFVRACQEEGSGLSACHCAEEQLQARLGYDEFLALASQGPAGFRADAAAAAHQDEARRLCVAADWAEPAPQGQSRWTRAAAQSPAPGSSQVSALR